MPVSNVPTPGSPIRSNWAQSVSTVANSGEGTIASKVAKAGDTMTGNLRVGGDPNTLPGTEVVKDGAIFSHVGTPSVPNYANMPIKRSGDAGAVGGRFVTFIWGSYGTIGTITIASTSSVAYNTTSDERLKERVGPVDDALAIVEALGAAAYRGRWIADEGQGEEWVFVNSQDVEPLAPYAVQGDPDAVATEADVDAGAAVEAGQIIPQVLDHGALVPLLLAAVSQLAARVTALEGAR